MVLLAVGWVGGLSAYIMASVPGPEIPLHDFERNPASALLAMLAGTVAATAFASARQREWSVPARVLATAAVYLIVAVPVGIAVFLWDMS
jgi:hypothetical protein